MIASRGVGLGYRAARLRSSCARGRGQGAVAARARGRRPGFGRALDQGRSERGPASRVAEIQGTEPSRRNVALSLDRRLRPGPKLPPHFAISDRGSHGESAQEAEAYETPKDHPYNKLKQVRLSPVGRAIKQKIGELKRLEPTPQVSEAIGKMEESLAQLTQICGDVMIFPSRYEHPKRSWRMPDFNARRSAAPASNLVMEGGPPPPPQLRNRPRRLFDAAGVRDSELLRRLAWGP